jgi:hypothetical protein
VALAGCKEACSADYSFAGHSGRNGLDEAVLLKFTIVEKDQADHGQTHCRDVSGTSSHAAWGQS